MNKFRLLFYISIFFISLPLIKMPVFPKAIKPLSGDIILAKKPGINQRNWLEASYQDSLEQYYNDKIGFRPVFVRLRNQICYSLFNEANARGIIRGKEDYLYEKNYIKTYYGLDFLGEDTIKMKVQNIKTLQNKLASDGKTLIICFAAGKGSFYPQYFPEKYIQSETDSTNYRFYSRELINQQVNFIDFNKWLIEIRDTCNCMLYPKYGIHWSHYAMLLAADSIIKFIEKKRDIVMPHIMITENKISTKLRYKDYDIAAGMNLMFQMKTAPMCYPDFIWKYDSSAVKPKVLVIADSFYNDMYNTGIHTNSFSLGAFWYYNKQILPKGKDKPEYVSEADLTETINENDVILLIVTEPNLKKFSWGFVENALSSLKIKC